MTLRDFCKFAVVRAGLAEQGVVKRRKDAQTALRAFLKGNVVLVGHALHHDLLALRIDYQPVIDTSLLVSYRCELMLIVQLVQVIHVGWSALDIGRQILQLTFTSCVARAIHWY